MTKRNFALGSFLLFLHSSHTLIFVYFLRSVVAPLLDPVIAILIEKLSDGNVRIREGARKGLEVLAGKRSGVLIIHDEQNTTQHITSQHISIYLITSYFNKSKTTQHFTIYYISFLQHRSCSGWIAWTESHSLQTGFSMETDLSKIATINRSCR